MNPSRDTPRALRLLRSDPLPPLPSVEDLLNLETPRRPGELHEAMPLSERSAQVVACQASEAGVCLDIAASLMLEAGLITGEAFAFPSGIGWQQNPEALALPEANARYLRSLTIGRRPSAVAPRRSVAVPVRLVPRLAAASVEDLIYMVELEVAIAWETSAVRQGRTMSEWALMQAQAGS